MENSVRNVEKYGQNPAFFDRVLPFSAKCISSGCLYNGESGEKAGFHLFRRGGDWAKRPFYRGGGRLKFYGAGQNRG